MSWKRVRWTLVEVCLACSLLLTAGAYGQTAGVVTTTIADTVYEANGSGASGTVLISWPAFAAYSGVEVPAGSTSVAIGSGGALNVQLVPNAGSTPMGSYYTVVYHLDDGSTTREYWVVPVSAGAVKLSAIRSTVLPTSVAMQTVSKSYVDTAITAAVTGHPLDASTPYVLKTGDTMTGPLVLPGDPTAALQAADKNYVDAQIAGSAAGLSQKVSLLPQQTQVIAQPAGTQLEVNNLNGTLYASQYANGNGNNGISNAAASPDCAGGCAIEAEATYSDGGGVETPSPSSWNDHTQLLDERFGTARETHVNPLPLINAGQNTGRAIDVISTQTADQVLAATGEGEQFSTGLTITNNGLSGGSNVYPKLIQSTVPYFKTTFSTLNMTSNNNTLGQHVLVPESQNCFGVGDCLMGGRFLTASGGFRDDGDEGAHPFDLQLTEDPRVFAGTCNSGCTPGSTVLQVAASAGGGTQGDGRYLIDTNPAKVLSAGQIVGGNNSPSLRQPVAEFSGTNFPVSVFLETAQTVPTQSNSINPGRVTVPIVTSGVPAGFQTNTAALPTTSGVACVSDVIVSDGRPLNFETAAYTVVDGSHLQMTFYRPHANGATIAVGGLCGYGLEQKADTVGAIRQMFPVIGSTSPTELAYASISQAALVGATNTESAYANVSFMLTSLVRNGNVVTATINGGFTADLNGLTLTISGVSDPSYNGSFAITTTGSNTFTYNQAGANSTSSGGTATYLTGSYALYPMAEVQKVYNAATRAVDGQMTLAANTVAWAPGDAVEQPHYFQETVYPDMEYVTQYAPRPQRTQAPGITYQGNTGPGIVGWAVVNGTDASSYYGNGGTHTAPGTGMSVQGEWKNSFEAEAGDNALLRVHCNSHGCSKWNSGYDLFQLDGASSVDRQTYQPATSTMNFNLRGTNYQFDPNAFTAGTVNAGTVNATALTGTLNGAVTPASLPVFGGSGAAHARGAVPDPGATAGNTRFLREDGTWVAAAASTMVASTSGYATQGPLLMPQRSSLLAEYLLAEGTGTVAHDTSGQGNDGTINGATWEGGADLNFTAQGQYIALPAAVNGAKAWQFALYAPPYGSLTYPQPPGYGTPTALGVNPAILCGTDTNHLCLIAGSPGRSMEFRSFTTDQTQSAVPLSAGWHVVSFLCGTNVNGVVTKTKILYDGAEVGGYVAQGDSGTCPNPASGNYQIGGSSVLTGTWFVGKVAAAWAWSTPLSVTDGVAAAKSALDYMKSKGVQTTYNAVPHAAPVVVAGMDSRTYGIGVPVGQSWVSQMTLNDATLQRVNFGVPGALTYDECAMFDAQYGPEISAGQGPAIVMLWGGVNDFIFSQQTSRQIATNLQCMVQKAKAAGAKVILATEISSYANNGTSGDDGKNGLNAILRAEAFGWGVDDLADLATDPHIGADGASGNTACFSDYLHPSSLCEPYITSIMQNAVNELTGSTERNRNQTAAATYQEVAADDFLDLTGTFPQTVTLPDCTGYSRTRQMVNLGSAGATVTAVNGQTLVGSNSVASGARALFVPVPGSPSASGCRWERTQ